VVFGIEIGKQGILFFAEGFGMHANPYLRICP
jgi:hypothetical protein